MNFIQQQHHVFTTKNLSNVGLNQLQGLLQQNDPVIVEHFRSVDCNMGCSAEIPQCSDDIDGKRFDHRPLFLGKTAGFGIRAFLAERTDAADQCKRFVISL